jgi:hypothetical protein
MNFVDDYHRHRTRYQYQLKHQARLGGEYPSCPWCGRVGVRIEFHHYGRRDCDDRAVPACRDCHDHFRYCEQHEHPKLSLNPKGAIERHGRVLLGYGDMYEVMASQVRETGALLIELAEKYPDLVI